MEIELNDTLDSFVVDPDAVDVIMVEIDGIRWQCAEPDVGIFSSYPDDWSEEYFYGDKSFSTSNALVAHLIDVGAYEGDCELMVKAIDSHIQDCSHDWEQD
jgi:hypothetical protein